MLDARTTRLLWAARFGHEAVVRVLLAAGADAKQLNEENGDFALLWAARDGHEAVVRVLLQASADAKEVNEKDHTSPLSVAVGNPGMMRLLLGL